MIDSVQEIKEKVDIVDVVRERVSLHPAGKNLKGLCPFHREKTPSFMVSPERQTWRCFGQCNEGGDVISFLMKYENLEFYEALKVLAEKAGVQLRSISPASQKEFGVLYDINVAAKDYFVAARLQSEEVKAYCDSRGILPQTLDTFEVGFAPDTNDGLLLHLVNLGYEMTDIERAGLAFKGRGGTYVDRFRGRIMFPLYNSFGKIVGFSGRILPTVEGEGIAKYINTPETPIFNKSKTLYGLHLAKQHIKEKACAVIVEGQMDEMMMWQDGVTHVVATSGTALTDRHLDSLRRLTDCIIFAFDSDEAGLAATERAIDMAHSLDFDVKIFTFPQGIKDAADFVLQKPTKLAYELEKAVSAIQFYTNRFLHDISPSSLKRGIRSILSKIVHLSSPIEKSRWISHIANHTKVPERIIYEELSLLSRKTARPQEPKDAYSNQRDVFALSGRHEGLASKVLMLAFVVPDLTGIVREHSIYFPPRFSSLAQNFANDNPQFSQDEKALLNLLEMRASLEYADIKTKDALQEGPFLLREIKREYLKSRRDELRSQIAVAEQEGNTEQLSKLLTEFDELVQMINN